MDIAHLSRHGKLVAIAAIFCLAAPSAVLAGTGNANFFLGGKALNKSDWEPLEDQAEFGAEVTFGRDGWPVSVAIDVLGSATEETESGIDFEGRTSELCVGVRKIWEVNRTRPYIGGGIALVTAEFEGDVSGVNISDDDNGIGAWIGGGVFWRLGSRFNLGIAARYSKAEVTLFGADGEAGGTHAGILLGWGWPASK